MALSFTAAAFAALLLPSVGAQTFSSCNPTTNSSCPPNPAITTNFECDFKNGESALNGWKTTAGSLSYAADGAQFTIKQRGDAPTIQTNGYFLFGRAEVKTKAASGQGIISSIVLQSEDLDEVDWEFIGGVDTEVQSNYFGKGNTTTYDRMQRHPVTTPQQTAHTYIVDWTAERINFYIDDTETPVRTLNFKDANEGKNYPQTPMNLRIGIWAGGDQDNSQGTIEWAGGQTDYSKGPFTQVLDTVKVTNYSPGKEYVWKDQTGSYQSIEVVAGEADTGSPSNPVTTSLSLSSSGVAGTPTSNAPAASSTSVEAGSPDSPGGLGGGNGGNTSAGPGEFFPTGIPSTSCSTHTATITVTGGSGETPDMTEPTVILPTGGMDQMPTSLAMDTEPVPTSVPAVSTIPIAVPSGSAVTPSPSQFTGAAAAAAPTGIGAVLLAGAMGAFLL